MVARPAGPAPGAAPRGDQGRDCAMPGGAFARAMQPCSALIVDDHPLLRDALALIDAVVVADFERADPSPGPGMGAPGFLAALAARQGPLPARIITADRGAALAAACAAAGVGTLCKPIDAAAPDAFLTARG
jgi:hypothetical protein